MLFQYNNYQGSVWFTSANYLTGKVLAIPPVVWAAAGKPLKLALRRY